MSENVYSTSMYYFIDQWFLLVIHIIILQGNATRICCQSKTRDTYDSTSNFTLECVCFYVQ